MKGGHESRNGERMLAAQAPYPKAKQRLSSLCQSLKPAQLRKIPALQERLYNLAEKEPEMAEKEMTAPTGFE